MNHHQVKEKSCGFIKKVRKYEHKYKVFSFLGAIFCLSMLILLVKIQASENTSNQQIQLNQATHDIMNTTYTPGCAVVFVNGIKTDYFNYGYSDLKSKLEINEHTLFIIGSNSKAFTGLGILLAESDGLLRLDDNVSAYIPWFKAFYQKEETEITIRQLLSHTSGVPYNAMFHCIQGDYDGILEEEIKTINPCNLSFAPGTAYEYVNHNYILLAYILRTATGEKYEDYIQKNILDRRLNKDNRSVERSNAGDPQKKNKPKGLFFLKNKTPANLYRFNIRLSLSSEDIFVS